MIDLLKTHPFFDDKPIASCTLLENQGYCNENYIVVADGVKYVVRKLLRDDIDRDFEWQVLGLAYSEGITAEPLVYDALNGFMVFEYLEGEHRDVEVESSLPPKTSISSTGGSELSTSESDLKSLAITLQKLHSIRLSTNPIVLQTDTSSINKYPKEYVLCHNDLNPKNIFFPVGWVLTNGNTFRCQPTHDNRQKVGWKTHSTKLIDFEYAGVNDKYFDLASVCVEFGLNEGMQKVFLESYFEAKAFNVEKFEVYKIIYRQVCDAWFESL